MPLFPADRLSRTAKALGLAGAVLLSQGFYCSQKSDPPGLPTVHLTDIHLKMSDPALGAPGVYLAWTYPADAEVSFFEIYQSTVKDSLGHSLLVQSAKDSLHTVLALPDSSRPFTLYFALRAVWVEPTGQKQIGDTLEMDSIRIASSLNILHPGNGIYLGGRTLDMQVQTASDNGVTIRMSYFEKIGPAWQTVQDTCLPTDRCSAPIFGNSVQRDSLILEQHPATDTVPALFCVVGTESFGKSSTGLIQSLGCSRFLRVNP